jgi:hypothetical protein
MFRRDYARVEAEFASGFDLRGARIDADDITSERGKFRCERAIAAAEIENPLARLRREQFHDGRPELCDEASVSRVRFGIPRLRGARTIRVVGHGG